MAQLQPYEPKSVLEHVAELRQKLLITAAVVLVGGIVTHFFHKEIIAFLLRPAGGQQLIFLSPLDPILLILKIDIVGGILIGFPAILWCLFSYIAPALSHQARKLIVFFCLTSLILLIGGLLYAFLVTIPLSLNFLFSIIIDGIQNQISAQSYIGFFMTQAVIIAAVFQIPIVIIGGIHLRAFGTKTLSIKRRYIYLIATVGLAVLTPTTDIVSLGIVLIPSLVIFEVSLIGGKILEYIQLKKK